MVGPAVIAPTHVPGWFGKLPGGGDFATRRFPDSARLQFDGWLQEGLQSLRLRHSDWTKRYLESPLWSFMLGENVVGPARWLGVLMPSVDAVGRYFPLIVASTCDPGDEPSSHWFSRVGAAALQGLEQDLDAVRFDAALATHFESGAHAAESANSASTSWPGPGQSLWLTEPDGQHGLRMRCAGLPLGEHFDSLFGFLDGAWIENVETM